MDELVKQCRDCLDCLCGECKYEHLQKPGNFVVCMNALLREVADAIEELIPFKKQVEKGMGLLDKAEELLNATKPRWIPVTERLPESGWYLTYGPTIKTEVLNYNSVEEVWSSERYYNIEVTHWMPIQEPPKED